MEFTKIQYAGRDYILIEHTQLSPDTNLPSLAIQLCNRYSGAGASGLVILREEDCSVDVFTHKGIRRDFDLSAAICASVYGCSKNGISHTKISQSGLSTDIMTVKQSDSVDVTADLGKGTFLPDEIGLASKNPVINRPVEVGNRILDMTALKIGNIFSVHETHFPSNLNFITLGEQITKHSLFNKKASAVFCELKSDSALFIRSYINGTGNVLSDASAAAAAALTLSRSGKTQYGREITVTSDGGEIYALCKKNNSVLINTKAQIVFTGII